MLCETISTEKTYLGTSEITQLNENVQVITYYTRRKWVIPSLSVVTKTI